MTHRSLLLKLYHSGFEPQMHLPYQLTKCFYIPLGGSSCTQHAPFFVIGKFPNFHHVQPWRYGYTAQLRWAIE
jgi:hypothetical protein